MHFGSSSAQVNLASQSPDTQGVYAGTEGRKPTLVVVNKDPDTPIAFDLVSLPFGSYFLQHEAGLPSSRCVLRTDS